MTVMIKRSFPIINRVIELWWNQTARPDITNRAAIAPVSGQGLGVTMWYEWAWVVIMCFLGCKGLKEEQIRRPESLRLRFLKGKVKIVELRLEQQR